MLKDLKDQHCYALKKLLEIEQSLEWAQLACLMPMLVYSSLFNYWRWRFDKDLFGTRMLSSLIKYHSQIETAKKCAIKKISFRQ